MRQLLLVLALIIIASPISAQATTQPRLTLPGIIYATAATGDLVSTAACFQANENCREVNPVGNFVRQHTGDTTMLLSGAALDLLTVWAVERWITPKHPKAARWLFIGGAVGRAWLVGHNLKVIEKLRQYPPAKR